MVHFVSMQIISLRGDSVGNFYAAGAKLDHHLPADQI